MAKTQTPYEELTEIFIQITSRLNDAIRKNTQEQLKIEKSLSNIKIKPDLTDIKINQQDYFEKINLQSQKHIELINVNSRQFEKLLYKFNTRNFNYLIILNLFFFLTSGISTYIAIKKSINKNELLELQNKNKEMESKILNVVKFFKENPKNLNSYEKWYKENRVDHFSQPFIKN